MIKLPTDRYGNYGSAVKARRTYRCDSYSHEACTRWVDPGEHYYRLVVFPGDVNPTTRPWIMRICRSCISSDVAPAFAEAIDSLHAEPVSSGL